MVTHMSPSLNRLRKLSKRKHGPFTNFFLLCEPLAGILCYHNLMIAGHSGTDQDGPKTKTQHQKVQTSGVFEVS